jgi:hypothetical protein
MPEPTAWPQSPRNVQTHARKGCSAVCRWNISSLGLVSQSSSSSVVDGVRPPESLTRLQRSDLQYSTSVGGLANGYPYNCACGRMLAGQALWRFVHAHVEAWFRCLLCCSWGDKTAVGPLIMQCLCNLLARHRQKEIATTSWTNFLICLKITF